MTATTLIIPLASVPTAAPAAAASSMPAWAMPALALFGAIALLAVLVAAARQERARRLATFEAWVRSAMDDSTAEAEPVVATKLLREGRGRPASLRRRRGGEWDTPIVPTVTARPERPERHRTRRI